MKTLSVVGLLFAVTYAAPTIKQRLGQAKESNLAQVSAEAQGCGCGCCPCDVDYPVIPEDEYPGAGNDDLGDGIIRADYSDDVSYSLATEFVPTTVTKTKSAAESCNYEKTTGKNGECGVRCRHFDISGGICVNEWVDSCDFQCGWEKTKGCSEKAQTCVSGLDDVDNVDLGDAQPTCLSVTVSTGCDCECDPAEG